MRSHRTVLLTVGNVRTSIGLERILRLRFIQHCNNLADLSCEEALYDSVSLRHFVGIDLGREPVSDATTMLKFRRLLHANHLDESLFAQVSSVLQSKGFKVNTGAIVNAPIIQAPCFTSNSDKALDPANRQTHKCQQWYYCMKLHIGKQTGPDCCCHLSQRA